MKLNKKVGKKIFVTAVTTAMVAAMAVPAFAEGTSYTGVNGSSVNIQKYLIMDEQAQVPNKTFSYTIAPGEAVSSTGTDAQLEVYAGSDSSKVSGTPTIGTAVFTQGQTTYDTAQALVSTGIQIQNGANDPVTLEDGEKYAKSNVAVDFSGVTFNEPGIYRYIITESASGDSAITDDDDASRTMDVYVIDDSGSLAVEGYVLHNNEAVVSRDGESLTADEKAYGYTNTYDTADLTITQNVAGNQASRDEYFKHTVTIANAGAGNVFDVDLSHADATTKTNGINTEAHTNEASITTDDSGAATYEVWLQNGQSIVIQGLGKGATYQISQDMTAMQNEGYSAEITNSDDEATVDSAGFTTSGTIGTDDGTVEFTNSRSGVLPTGIAVTAGSGIALLMAAAAVITFFAIKRKKASKEN